MAGSRHACLPLRHRGTAAIHGPVDAKLQGRPCLRRRARCARHQLVPHQALDALLITGWGECERSDFTSFQVECCRWCVQRICIPFTAVCDRCSNYLTRDLFKCHHGQSGQGLQRGVRQKGDAQGRESGLWQADALCKHGVLAARRASAARPRRGATRARTPCCLPSAAVQGPADPRAVSWPPRE